VQVFEPGFRGKRVDLIVVVDDSASMGAFAERWAIHLGAFADVIESDSVDADVRIAITTTSVPSPTCAGPRALGGEPIVTTCRAHLDDFVTADEHGEHGGAVTDRRAICGEACSLTEIPRVLSPGRDEHDLTRSCSSVTRTTARTRTRARRSSIPRGIGPSGRIPARTRRPARSASRPGWSATTRAAACRTTPSTARRRRIRARRC
jgi:hypothetical protein